MRTRAPLPLVASVDSPEYAQLLAAMERGDVVTASSGETVTTAHRYTWATAHLRGVVSTREAFVRAVAHFDRPVYLLNRDADAYEVQNTGAEPYAAHVERGRDLYVRETRTQRYSDEPAGTVVEIVTMRQPDDRGAYAFGLEFRVATVHTDREDAQAICDALNTHPGESPY